jgi:hypothetical protein
VNDKGQVTYEKAAVESAAQAATFTADELVILLDAIMAFYHSVESVPANDGSNLPEIEAIQRKIEALFAKDVRDG